MALDWSRLEEEVRDLGTVVESVVATVRTVAEALRTLEVRDAEAQAKINTFADQFDAEAGRLAAAIKESTPAAPEPAPAVPVDDVVPVDGAVTPSTL